MRKPKQKIIKLQNMPIWCKGLKIDEEEGLILVWSQLYVTINDLHTGKLFHQFSDMQENKDYMTDMLLMKKYKYFLTSSQSGIVRAWKLEKG